MCATADVEPKFLDKAAVDWYFPYLAGEFRLAALAFNLHSCMRNFGNYPMSYGEIGH